MPSVIINHLLEENKKFLNSGKNAVYHGLEAKQTPKVTLVTCSDSRVPPSLIKEDSINYLFAIENIGNQIKTTEGSIDYGVLHLKTPTLVILGHTSCGAITVSCGDYSKETPGIIKELDTLFNDISEYKQLILEDDKHYFDKLSELNVDAQIKFAMDKYSHLVKEGKLAIIGLMLDFTQVYGENKGKIYITNVNGETDVNNIINMPLLDKIDKNIHVNIVKRLVN
jgi:carbonic anhydrase